MSYNQVPLPSRLPTLPSRWAKTLATWLLPAKELPLCLKQPPGQTQLPVRRRGSQKHNSWEPFWAPLSFPAMQGVDSIRGGQALRVLGIGKVGRGCSLREEAKVEGAGIRVLGGQSLRVHKASGGQTLGQTSLFREKRSVMGDGRAETKHKPAIHHVLCHGQLPEPLPRTEPGLRCLKTEAGKASSFMSQHRHA